MRRIIVAITGASGAVYGVRLLHALRAAADIETHLLVTPAGVLNLKQELDVTRGDVERLADVVHNVRDIGATIASGSFVTHGMVIAPCSMKTLAAIAHGLADNLIARAADVCLKERRRLVLLVREAPLNLAHIRKAQHKNKTTRARQQQTNQQPQLIQQTKPAMTPHTSLVLRIVNGLATTPKIIMQAAAQEGFSSAWRGIKLDQETH